jgi:hypothetical protein
MAYVKKIHQQLRRDSLHRPLRGPALSTLNTRQVAMHERLPHPHHGQHSQWNYR